MKKEDELMKKLQEMTKDTRLGKIHWNIQCQTTEYNDADKKPVVEEDGKKWTVDECYVSYHCEYKGKEFLMITYEMIHTAGKETKTTNMVFLPPLGIRFFDIHTLLPYAVDASSMLSYHIQTLWKTLLEMYKANPASVSLDVSERTLTIEDETI